MMINVTCTAVIILFALTILNEASWNYSSEHAKGLIGVGILFSFFIAIVGAIAVVWGG